MCAWAVDMEAGAELQLFLLGGFCFRHREGELNLPQTARRLVAFLAMQVGPVQRDFVASTLWTDATDVRANASLRSTVWRLGRTGSGIIRTEGATMALHPDVRVDVMQATERARSVIQRPDDHSRRDIEILGRRGELLPDWYDEWLVVERARFREIRVRALESLSRSLASVGSYDSAAEAALAAIACEPLRESAHRALIAVYAEEGNWADAHRHYELYRRQLDDTLGLEPSERMALLMATMRPPAGERLRDRAGVRGTAWRPSDGGTRPVTNAVTA
jgi:DNA-binding SARP family transcriptional activator